MSHAMQLQIEEANAMVIREREAAREAIEEAPPVTKETPVIVQDTEKVDSLTAEVERLKASLLSQTQAAEEAKQACAAAQAQNEELTTKLGDAEKKVDQLEDSVQSFIVQNCPSSACFLINQGLCASPQSAGFSFLNGRVLGGLDDLRQVEAKYPALLFKQQLTAFLEKIYGMIRDNLKKEISPLLGLCIQRRSQANAVAQQALIAHWQSIVKSLNYYLKIMKANHVSFSLKYNVKN
ncbi:LOW QUALITY PROTEIN: myosin-17 [Vitis vinifera]|uniref:LOW QUALITY PROTEIN: myosin-17 n=1 Tax=Vitis vinifera TaxID=29760 RepID=UPI00288316BA|nr:LOW QUALITY PROTEIN: myosin-17 [Vitis vinifera]